jgi:hypothetical protein
MDVAQLKIDIKDGILEAQKRGLGITHSQWISSGNEMVCPLTAAYIKAHNEFPETPSKVMKWARKRYGEFPGHVGTIPVFLEFAANFDDNMRAGHGFQSAIEKAILDLVERIK